MSLPETDDFDELQHWASIILFQLASPAKHGYPTQICLTEGKIFSNSLHSQHLGPFLMISLHLAFYKTINGRSCHPFLMGCFWKQINYLLVHRMPHCFDKNLNINKNSHALKGCHFLNAAAAFIILKKKTKQTHPQSNPRDYEASRRL